MRLALLVVALGCAVATPVKDSRIHYSTTTFSPTTFPPTPTAHPVPECPPSPRPWLVHFSAGCSGALINEWWVLTTLFCQISPQHTVASLGENDLNVEEGTEQRIPVARAVWHDPYRSHRSPMHTLQLVKLAMPARLNSHVRPVPLPTRCPHTGEECEATGWGATHPNQPSPSTPRCLVQPIIDEETCRDTYPWYWSPYMYCAGYMHTAAADCMNDGGSPMVCEGQLQGVLSGYAGCSETGGPDSYASICHYLGWIDDIMNSHEPTTAGPWTT